VDLELTEDQKELQASVRAFLERECPPGLVRRVVESRIGIFPPASSVGRSPFEQSEPRGSDGEGEHGVASKEVVELFGKMAELDWPAISVPTEYGGLGLGPVEVAIVAEQLGRVVAPGPLLSTISQFVPGILTAEGLLDREVILRALATGSLKGTAALFSRPARLAEAFVGVVATPVGGGFVLSGVKDYVMEASLVDEVLVFAGLAGGRGEAGSGLVLLVPRAELSVEPVNSLDASRELARVSMEGLMVESSRLVAEDDGALRLLETVTAHGAAAMAAEIVGTCQAIFEMVLAHLSTREQFGVKIGSFQAMKHKAADMYIAIESARALAYFAAAALAEGDDRAALAVSMAKAAAGDCQELVAEQGIQCLGGIGYTWEHDMHLFVKRAKTSALLFGTAAEHRQRVASLIGLRGSSGLGAAGAAPELDGAQAPVPG